jgi:hypothetical protein
MSVVLPGCAPGPSHEEEVVMEGSETEEQPDAGLVGLWVQVEERGCHLPFPHRIHFLRDGTYRGERDPLGTFTIWDVGSWEVEAGATLRISTATDEEMELSLSREGGEMEVRDEGGCVLRYRRSGGSGP